MTISETGNNSIDSLLVGYSWLPGATGSSSTAVTTITYSFLTSNAENMSGFQAMTAAQEQGVQTALLTWENVANIRFVQVAGGGQIQFGTADLGTSSSAQTDWHYNSTEFTNNFVYLNNNGNYTSPTTSSFNLVFTPGSYGPSVLIHEIGHSLGFKHPGDYGGSTGPYLPSTTDNRDYSVMSYNNGTAYNDYYYQFAGDVYSVTPMLYDIQAMQYLYGANKSYNSGNTTYSFTTFSAPQAIWDGGGVNTFDFSACAGATIIDLNAGNFSSTYVGSQGGADNVAIAYGTTIQNAIASVGGSTIYCNSSADTITGGAGNDTVYLSTGTVSFDGKGGTNTVVLTAAADLSGDSFSNVQALNLAGFDATLTTEQYTQLSGTLENAGAIHFADKGSAALASTVTTYYLATGDTISAAGTGAWAIHSAGTTDTLVLPGNAADYVITAGATFTALQDTKTGAAITVDLYGDATLQFTDASVATTSTVFSCIAAQNETRAAANIAPFHYGVGNQTTDNVIGEQSASMGSGYNAVILAGDPSQYGVSVNSAGTLTLSDTAAGKSYTITGDSFLIFDNGASGSNAGFQNIDFILQGNNALVAALYNAALGRLPDLAGLEYYGDSVASGALSLHQTAVNFLASPEFQTRFSAASKAADDGGPNDQAFINQLYQNVLHRTPAASEAAYYAADLQGTTPGVPQLDRAQLLINFSASPENQKDISGWLI